MYRAAPVIAPMVGDDRFEPGLVVGVSMIRSELVQRLVKANPGLSLREVDAIVNVFFDRIVDHLAKDGRVELRGFGAFSTRSRGAHLGRNPRTGRIVEIESKRVPHFKPGKDIRARINE
jgi:integration host factor subunit beta